MAHGQRFECSFFSHLGDEASELLLISTIGKSIELTCQSHQPAVGCSSHTLRGPPRTGRRLEVAGHRSVLTVSLRRRHLEREMTGLKDRDRQSCQPSLRERPAVRGLKSHHYQLEERRSNIIIITSIIINTNINIIIIHFIPEDPIEKCC